MQEFFKDKKVLIFGGTSSIRAYLRTVFKERGVESPNIFTSMDFTGAMENLKSHKPEILFLDFKVDNKSCLPLIHEHIKMYPNRFETLILTMGQGGIFPDHSNSKDNGSDLFLQKPISQELITRVFDDWYKNRNENLEKIEALNSVKEKYHLGENKACLELIEKYQNSDLLYAEIFHLKGKIFESQGDTENALSAYMSGLELDSHNYHCIKSMYQILTINKQYAKAYSYVRSFIKNHPIDPVDIPEITKTFIAKEQFEEFIDFCDKYISLDNFDLMKTDDSAKEERQVFDETAQKISICLLACGRFLNQQQKSEKAKKSLVQASSLCGDNYKLLGQIANEMLLLGEKDELEKLFKKVPSDQMSAELETIKFLLDLEIYSDAEALKFGLELINSGAKDHRIYEQVLIRSMRMKRRAEFIDELAHDAIKNFPEHENCFLKFVRKSA